MQLYDCLLLNNIVGDMYVIKYAADMLYLFNSSFMQKRFDNVYSCEQITCSNWLERYCIIGEKKDI